MLRACLVFVLASTIPLAAQSDTTANENHAGTGSQVHGFGYELPSVSKYEIAQAISKGMAPLRQKWFASARMQQPIEVTGTAIFDCHITRDGAIRKVSVVQSSGDPMLDTAASTLLADASFAGLPSSFKGTELRTRWKRSSRGSSRRLWRTAFLCPCALPWKSASPSIDPHVRPIVV